MTTNVFHERINIWEYIQLCDFLILIGIEKWEKSEKFLHACEFYSRLKNFAWWEIRGRFYEFLLFSRNWMLKLFNSKNFLISSINSINDFLILIGVMKVIIVRVKFNIQIPDQYSLIKNKVIVVICRMSDAWFCEINIVKVQLEFIS